MSEAENRVAFYNSLSGLLPLLVNLVIVFLMSPIMVRQLGNRDYGIWELLIGLVGYLGVLDLGVGPALVRYVSHAHGRDDHRSLEETFNTGFLALTLAGGLGFLILGSLSLFPSRVLNLPSDEANSLTPLLLLFGGNLLIGFPNSAMGAYLLGLQKHRFLNIYLVVTGICEAVAAYYILISGTARMLVLLCLMRLMFNIIRSIVYFSWIMKGDAPVRLSIMSFKWSVCCDLLAFGVKNVMLIASFSLIRSMIPFVIAQLVGVAAIVFFIIPNRLIDYAQAPSEVLSAPLYPLFTSLAAKGDIVATRTAWLQATRLLQVVTIGAPVAMIWLGEPFIRRWMGAEYASLGHIPLMVLTVGLFVRGISVNSTRLMMSLARHGQIAMFSSVAAILMFLLSFPLTRIAGIIGAALAVSLFAVVGAWWELVLASRVLGILPIKYVLSTLGRFAAPCLLTSLVFGLLRVHEYPLTYSTLLLHGVIGGVIYLVTVVLLTLTRGDRQFLYGLVKPARTEQTCATTEGKTWVSAP